MSKYDWLKKEQGPKHLVEAVKLIGTLEAPGDTDNQTILNWAKEIGLEDTYTEDAIPWCGLFVALVVYRAGRVPVKDPLWARNWAKFGVAAPKAMLGDILVFVRDGGGHVGLYVGEDATTYTVLGGNQADSVSLTRILKSRCVAIRRPEYKNQPENIRSIELASNGSQISTNEA